MAGLYIHVPFCKTICKYCDFYKISNLSLKDLYVSSLLSEIDNSEYFFYKYPIRTIYFGGGTPSLLSLADYNLIFTKLQKKIDISLVEEITVEINPDDFNESFAKSLLNTPVNRLSFGLQSVYDDVLIFLGRRHNSNQIFDALNLASQLNYTNVTVDLIYGIPNLTNDMWIYTLDKLFEFPFKHLSAYHLIIEKNTSFYKDLTNNRLKEVDESLSFFQYNYLVDYLKNKDFLQYEVSNFSMKGFESKHNSLYWIGEEYLGLGPSSHSYFDRKRKWNVSNVVDYNKMIAEKQNVGVVNV